MRMKVFALYCICANHWFPSKFLSKPEVEVNIILVADLIDLAIIDLPLYCTQISTATYI